MSGVASRMAVSRVWAASARLRSLISRWRTLTCSCNSRCAPCKALSCDWIWRQHLIEGVSQNADFIAAHFLRPDRIVLIIRNGLRGAGEAKDRSRDEPLKSARKNERQKKRGGQNQSENTAVKSQ